MLIREIKLYKNMVYGKSATFLPHVATKQGWDRIKTLQQLCKKAGLEANAWKAKDAMFRVYETQIFYEE